MKDTRIEKVRRYIEMPLESRSKNRIYRFGQIFDHFPKDEVAAHLDKTPWRFNYLVDNLGDFKMGELFRMADFFGVAHSSFIMLIEAERIYRGLDWGK